MKNKIGQFVVIAGMLFLWAPAGQTQQKPTLPPMPQPGVPEIFTMEAAFVRAAYNNEGYAILGYEPVQRSIGEEWVLLDIGVTLREGVQAYKMTREALSISTPDGKTIPLATVAEHRAANTQALQARANVQRDSINYFPPKATRACRIGFFAELGSPAMPWDEVEVTDDRACLGRIFFKVPGGIKLGQHFLNVKFAKSVVRVPFRILTKEEEQTLNKNYRSIREQIQDHFKKGGK